MALEITHTIETYLRVGGKGPFLGELPYEKARRVHDERKAAIKERGAKWTPNPEYVEGARGGTRGWWAAPNRHVLLELLKLKPGDGMGTTPLWLPCGVGPMGAVLMLKLCMDEKVAEEAADAQARKKREPSLEDKEREERSRLDIPNDSAADVAALLELGIVHSRELMERARRYASDATGSSLGPRSGISDAARLLRGVRLGIVTVEEARECRRVEEAPANVGAGAPLDEVRAAVSAPLADPYRVVKRRKLQSDNDAPACDEFDEGLVCGLRHGDLPPDTVTCEQCDEQVNLQFMACACPYSEWEFTGDELLMRRKEECK